MTVRYHKYMYAFTCLLFFPDFKRKWKGTSFLKSPKRQISRKSVTWESCFPMQKYERADVWTDRRTNGYNEVIVTFPSCFAIAPENGRLPATVFRDNYMLLSYFDLSLSRLYRLTVAVTTTYGINLPFTVHAKQSSECTITTHSEKKVYLCSHWVRECTWEFLTWHLLEHYNSSTF
jgi:hypothetical protein